MYLIYRKRRGTIVGGLYNGQAEDGYDIYDNCLDGYHLEDIQRTLKPGDWVFEVTIVRKFEAMPASLVERIIAREGEK